MYMKFICLFMLLIFINTSYAQDKTHWERPSDYSFSIDNRFTLPAYINHIHDAEKVFSENELLLLEKSIDSIYKFSNLKIQVAFVTPNYYEKNNSKFNLFADTLSKKWNVAQYDVRFFLIVSMRDRLLQINWDGKKANAFLKNLSAFKKEGREPTDIEILNMKNVDNLSNKFLIEESMLGINLKAKNYVKALNGYFNAIIKNQHLFFDY